MLRRTDPDIITERCEREHGICSCHYRTPARWLVCEDCERGAWIVDCGCLDQPRPLSADGVHIRCEECHVALEEA